MVMQRTDFQSNGGFCKTDRGLVEVDNNQERYRNTPFNIICIMRTFVFKACTVGQSDFKPD